MTPRQKVLVQGSFAALAPIAAPVAALFYRRLIELDPSLQHLVRGDRVEQGRQLMRTLTIAVRGLDRLEWLAPALQTIRQCQAAYGVRDAHYATAAQALLWTLEQALGEAFTPEVRAAWVAVYDLLATRLQQAELPAAA